MGRGPASECLPPEESISAYAETKVSVDKSTIWLPHLPGQKEPSPSCGNPVPYHCTEHHESFWTKSHCLNRDCPDCMELWANKEANRASRRIAWGAKTLKIEHYQATTVAFVHSLDDGFNPDAQYRKSRLNHFVVSIELESEDLESMTLRAITRYQRKAYDVVKLHGIVGGCCVVHPFRKDRYDKFWTKDHTVHFHFVGFTFRGWKSACESEDENLDSDERAGYIVFKALPDEEYGDYKGLRSGRAIKRLLQYLLTHCGVDDNEHSLVYFGQFSYNKLSKARVENLFRPNPEGKCPSALADTKGPPKCPICGSGKTEPCYGGTTTFGFYKNPEAGERDAVPDHFIPDYPSSQTSIDESIWLWLKQRLKRERRLPLSGICRQSGESIMTDEGFVFDDYRDYYDWNDVSKIVEWNLRTKRLVRDGDGIRLGFPPTLDYALYQLRLLTQIPPWRERVSINCCGCGVFVGNAIVDKDRVDSGLLNVWCESCRQDSLRERGIETKLLDESSHPDRNLDDASMENGGTDLED